MADYEQPTRILDERIKELTQERDEARELLADIQDNEYVVSVTTAQRLNDLLKQVAKKTERPG